LLHRLPRLKIDRSAPSTTASAPTDWSSASVTVTFVAGDNLSGVAATHYAVDGGATRDGTSLVLTEQGVYALHYWSEDLAGNVEAAKQLVVGLDLSASAIGHTQAPIANLAGWNSGAVTITWSCTDDASGVASCSAPATVASEGANQTVIGTAVDYAGLRTDDPVTLNLDLAAPTISAAADRVANADGWYRAPVTVSFACADALSGLASCAAPITLAGEGAGQAATGGATDRAGNVASATVSGVDVDTTAPTIIYTGNAGTPTRSVSRSPSPAPPQTACRAWPRRPARTFRSRRPRWARARTRTRRRRPTRARDGRDRATDVLGRAADDAARRHDSPRQSSTTNG
jgi:hypothetical protein